MPSTLRRECGGQMSSLNGNGGGVVRFGVFELDTENAELRKNGKPLRLPPQPLRLLTALVSQPGKLITREELQHHIWNGTTFVDFEQGLNFCVRRIRAVLDDSAEAPHFIETVPRRGYRFIAQVESVVPRQATTSPSNRDGHAVQAISGNKIRVTSSSLLRLSGWLAAALVTGTICAAWVVLFVRQSDISPKLVRVIAITNDGRQKMTNTPYFLAPIVSDGARLYFQEAASAHSAIAQVALTGGDTELLATPFRSAQLAGISPDHSNILLADMYSESTMDLPFYSLPVIGGTAKRLGDFLAHDAAWSPDGERLAYATKDELRFARKDGSPAGSVVMGIGIPWWPRWSSDGKKVRFTVTDPKTQSSSIWDVGSDGSRLHPVLPDWNDHPSECCGDWTPDGKYFVFQATRDGTTGIWVLPEGHDIFKRSKINPTKLTAGPMETYVPLPRVSPNKIYVIGAKSRGEVVRYESRKKRFQAFLGGISASDLAFSPDAQSIVYVQYPEATMWRARRDATERVQLTSSPLLAMLPTWSPDGKQIALVGVMPGKPWKVYLIPSDGGEPRELLPDSLNEGDPTWSPDGASLAFGRLPWKTGTQEPAEIYVVDLKSRRVTTLPGSEGLFSPRWSPNRKYLLAIKSDSTALMIFDFVTQKWSTLAQGLLASPSWSRDAKYVYALDAHEAHKSAIVRIRLSDGKFESVADLNDIRLISGGGIGLDPDDAPLTVRDVGTEEIYALEWTPQ
jgi:Tol biopolymer transport system component/DNA-binding winged helix-turn-helix (wHTH) protein